MTALRVLALLMEDSDRPLVLVRPEDVRQRLLRCNGVADEDLAELAISLVLDRVTIELWTASTFVHPKFMGALFDFRHRLGFHGALVQELRLSQVLDPPLLHPRCLIGIEHLGQDLPLVGQRP